MTHTVRVSLEDWDEMRYDFNDADMVCVATSANSEDIIVTLTGGSDDTGSE